MWPAKIFLTIVGLLYIYLGVWCSLSPQTTSNKVGLERIGDSGRSEFLTVYGGLEVGMGLAFLMVWLWPQFAHPLLGACLIIHASLVVFRTIGFFYYPDVSKMTYQLAISEWVILLVSVLALWGSLKANSSG